MNTFNKDKKRYNSQIIQNNHFEAWNLSYKYSTILLNKINHKNIFELCFSIHENYINELKQKKIIKSIKKNKNKNYIQVWNTMLNSMKKNHNISSIRLLQQTSQQRKK